MRISAVPLHEADLIRRTAVEGFAVTEAWSPPRRIPAHAHAALSITLVLDGAFQERYAAANHTRRTPHECEPCSLLIRPAGEVHENHLGKDGSRTLSIEVSPARLELNAKRLAPISRLSLRRGQAFLDIGLALSRELRHSDEASPLALESLVLELLARLLRLEARGAADAAPAWLLRARDAIHAAYRDQSLRVSRLAHEQGVHPVYFARAFRRHFLMTPGEYVRRLRSENACARIRSSAASLAEIAMECGFADQSHMHRALRRRFGLTPRQMRRRP